MRRLYLLVRLVLLFLPLEICSGAATLTGPVRVHDPSTILSCNGRYYLFATGRGILSRSSSDLVTWQQGPPVFTNTPAWARAAVPRNRGDFWAPDVIRLKDKYLLYYSISSWGSRRSAIGLAISATLDPADPAYGWSDRGAVTSTTDRDNFNAIDPGLLLDSTGRLWMTFGSYWSGIKAIELDTETGLRKKGGAPVAVAWNNSIEASSLLEHAGNFYLFVNWGQCCRGTNSTYNIRVGRGAAPTGPFLDRNGKDLLTGGGSLLLKSAGERIGPGHAAFLRWKERDWMTYHYYSAQAGGEPRLGMVGMRWEDGWPVLTEPNPEVSR